MPPRARRLALAAGSATALLLAALACLVHVPVGELAATGHRLLLPGWHLRAPLAAVFRFPAAGDLTLPLEEARSREGARIPYRLQVSYEADAGALLPRAEALARGGLEGALEEELEALRAELGRRSAADLRAGPLPPDLEGFLRQGLGGAGLTPTRLTLVAAGGEGPSSQAGGGPDAPRLEAAGTGVRVLLIGLDGADWSLAEPLMAAGEMPALAGLLRRGSRAVLRSYDPMMSPLLWTTVVTGVGPDRHGVADFLAYGADGDRRLPISSRFRRVPALWNLTGRAGLRAGFVGWWASHPAEAVDGFMVSHMVPFRGPRISATGAVHPPSYLDQVASRLVAPSEVPDSLLAEILQATPAEIAAGRRAADAGAPEKPSAEGEDPVAFTLRALTQGLNTLALGEDLLARDLDLVGLYFEGIDLMGHRFQHCLPPRMSLCPEEDWRRYRDAVPAFYRLQDRWLARLLAAAGEGWTVMVVSDHGFASGSERPARVLPFTTGQPVEWHRRDGIFAAAGPGIAAGNNLAPVTLFDIAPTILALMGLPVASDLEGEVLARALEPDFRQQFPVRTIPTYGARSVEADTAAGAVDPEAQEELLRLLQGLGYVGDESGGTGAAPRAAGRLAPGPERPTVTYHRNLATYHLNRGEFTAAEASLRAALALKPLPKTYQLLAETLVELGRPGDAVAALESGMEAFPDLALENVLWAVEILVGQGRAGEAAALLARHADAARRKPGLEAACRGLLAAAAGREGEAVALYLEALESDPSRTMPARHLLPLLARRGEAGRLEPFLRQAVRMEPRGDEGWGLLGAVLGLEKRQGEAVEALEQAVALAPGNSQWVRNLAVALGSAGRHQEAAATFRRLTALLPGDAGAWLGLGTALRLGGDGEGAVAAFRRAAEIDPAGAEPALGLAVALAQTGQADAARRTVEEALRRHPAHPGLRKLAADLPAAPRSGS